MFPNNATASGPKYVPNKQNIHLRRL